MDVLGEPFWNGTTAAAPEVLVAGCSTTRDAVIVVPSTMPSTSTDSPSVTLPDVALTVIFCPPEVVRVKPEADVALAVPVAPPSAGPERALGAPLLRDTGAVLPLGEVADGAALEHAATTTTAHDIMAATTTLRIRLFVMPERIPTHLESRL